MSSEHHYWYSPPKAEATGSNPVGCTNTFNGLDSVAHGPYGAGICAVTQQRTKFSTFPHAFRALAWGIPA